MAVDETQQQQAMGEYMQFTQQLQSAGQYVTSSQLHPTLSLAQAFSSS